MDIAGGCYRRRGAGTGVNAQPGARSGSTRGRVRWQTPAMAKVTIIGAGSVEFTRNILTDLCSYAELHGTLSSRCTTSTRNGSPTRSAPPTRWSSGSAPATR